MRIPARLGKSPVSGGQLIWLMWDDRNQYLLDTDDYDQVRWRALARSPDSDFLELQLPDGRWVNWRHPDVCRAYPDVAA